MPNKITQRQIIGEFYKRLSVDTGAEWVNGISNLFGSDQESEEYAWLGQVPQMREWVGGRNAVTPPEFDMTIRNKHFESTVDFLVRDMRRDKTAQIMARIRDLAARSQSHWAKLLSDLIVAGTSTTCYDGQFFFDTDHSEGDSGTQDNDITVDISGLPVATHGTVTVPSVAEMQLAIAKGIEAIVGFVDNTGEPMNENASAFLAMVPTALMNVAMQAVATPVQVAETQTALEALKQDFAIRAVANTRLSDWTDSFAVFRTDSEVKALIRQEETPVMLKVKGEGSEYEFDNDAHQYGVDTWRNVGYGYWQNACYVTLV